MYHCIYFVLGKFGGRGAQYLRYRGKKKTQPPKIQKPTFQGRRVAYQGFGTILWIFVHICSITLNFAFDLFSVNSLLEKVQPF